MPSSETPREPTPETCEHCGMDPLDRRGEGEGCPVCTPLTRCALPPDGWRCSRAAGHDGPCAARRVEHRALPPEIETALDENDIAVRREVLRPCDVTTRQAKEARAALAAAITRSLAAATERAERDAERLDYLQYESCNVRAVMDMDPEAEVGFVVSPSNDNPMPGRTLRDAIDACMHGEYDVPNTPVAARAVEGRDP